MNKNGNRYEQLIHQMSAGLDRCLLRILGYHLGREQAIGREALVTEAAHMGFAMHERQIREGIKSLRRKGYLICSAAGEDGGYYLAASRQEYEEFRLAEYAGKIADMVETMQAMDSAAREQFGEGVQARLF